ncbi:MAG: 6-carboxytetrahydropterin synthase [Alloprevotella sp.]|nr:6-carboxytetrahydropterin synthase [Alloprevotella sp.]
MYYLSKRIEIAFAHQLQLDYESPCRRLHGHNAIVTVFCCAEELNENGMVVDFKHVKEIVKGRLDHQCLNDLFDFNPTAENIARWICDQIPQCYKVTVQESEGNVAAYVKDPCADDKGL